MRKREEKNEEEEKEEKKEKEEKSKSEGKKEGERRPFKNGKCSFDFLCVNHCILKSQNKFVCFKESTCISRD